MTAPGFDYSAIPPGVSLPVPPSAVQAEQSVLGGLLIDNSVWPKVQGLLSARDFYRREHQVIFSALESLLSAGRPADVVTLDDLLTQRGLSAEVGGLSFLVVLARDTPSSANVGSYAQIVRNKSMLRQLIAVSGQIRDAAMATDADAKAAIAAAESAIFAMAQSSLKGNKGFERLRDIQRRVLTQIEDHYDKPPSGVLGVSTGFADIDQIIPGLCGGDLVILAGRPSIGKSALAMNFSESAALAGVPVAFFEMEMPSLQLGQRVTSSLSGVPLQTIIRSWTIQDNQWPLLTSGFARSIEAPLFIDDTPGLRVSDIRSRCMKLNAEIRGEYPSGIGMIIIDYLQLMSIDHERGGNRSNEIGDITRRLKSMAKEFDIPIIILSQLNRGLESRPNKRPILSDLRDSGEIEQDGDIVLFVYRDEVYNKDSVDAGIAEVIVAKHRNGALGSVRLGFDGPCTRFRNLAEYY